MPKRKRPSSVVDEYEKRKKESLVPSAFIPVPFKGDKPDDFEVRPVDDALSSNDTSFQLANDSLVQPPFQMVVVSPTNSGKSTMIVNLITRKQFGYADYFTRVRVWSESLCTDNIWQVLTDKQLGDSFDEYDEEKIREVWDEQKERVLSEGREKHRELWIFDDMVSNLKKGSGGTKSNVIMDLYMRGRHTNISIIVTSQSYKMMPTTTRKNARWLILFQITNLEELKAIYNELGIEPTFRDFRQMCAKVWEHKYAFVNSHIFEPRIEDRYFFNFTHQITPQLEFKPLETRAVDNRRNENVTPKELKKRQKPKHDDVKKADEDFSFSSSDEEDDEAQEKVKDKGEDDVEDEDAEKELLHVKKISDNEEESDEESDEEISDPE